MKKLKIIAGALACMMLAGCTSKAQKEQEEMENLYAQNLNLAVSSMETGESLAETLCEQTSNLWMAAIKDDYNSRQFKFKKDANGDGKIDFNDALTNFYADDEVVKSVELLDKQNELVENVMKELVNPPEKYSTCYTTVTDCYKSYTQITSLAKSPTGSYNDYTSNYKQYGEAFLSNYNLAKTQLPDVSNISISK